MNLIDRVTDLFTKEKVPKPEEFQKMHIFCYDDEKSRIATAEWLLDQAKSERSPKEAEWERMNDYYNGKHDVMKDMEEALNDMDIPFVVAGIPDPFIMVESQITPDVPMPEFHGRDNDLDSFKAKKRQKAVQFVLDNNRVSDMNTANERRLRKYGDALWKVYWDEDMPCGAKKGDIRVKDIPIQDVYFDPTAKKIEECEYIAYVYTMHKLEFWRKYHKVLKKKDKTLEEVMKLQYQSNINLLEQYPSSPNAKDDLVQVLEFWYKQPYDADGAMAGDIACSIQASGVELNYIPCYWEKTHVQNRLFPFIHYWCIHDETQFYNKSEIEPIMGLVDNADREIAIGILNDAMMGNDIILQEEDALVPGEQISNIPGSVVKVEKGMINSVARLGGLNNGINVTPLTDWLLNQIQRTNRNWDTNNGQETAKVTTASGLLQLRSDAAEQGELKKADRNKGFCRLFELIDWTCLEFYDDDRLLYIGADDTKGEQDEDEKMMRYDTSEFLVYEDGAGSETIIDPITGDIIREAIPPTEYYPRVDVTVTTGDGLAKNPASTVQVLDKLAAVEVTQDNYQILSAELDYLDIPQKQQIQEQWQKKFESIVPPELIEALNNNPQVVAQLMAMMGVNPNQPSGGTQMGVQDIMPMQPDVPTY